MRRSSAVLVTAAALVAVTTCSNSGDQPDRSHAASSSAQANPPDAVLLAEVPPGLVAPDGFNGSAGFALRTVVGGSSLDGAVRDTWELLPQGIASYGTDATGHPVVELASLTGESLWHH